MAGKALLIDSEDGVASTLEEVGPVLEGLGLEVESTTDVEDGVLRVSEGPDVGIALLVLGSNLTHPVAVARRLSRVTEQPGLVFLSRDSSRSLQEELSAPLARIRMPWSVVPLGSARTVKGLESAVRAARHRAHLRTTLSRANAQLSSTGPAELSELHRYTMSPRFLADLLEQAPDAIIATAPNGRIVAWNRAAERMFGLPRDGAIGRAVVELRDDRWSEAISDVLGRLRDSEEASLVRNVTFTAAEGKAVEAEVRASHISEDVAGAPGFSMIVRDMTARRRLERQLRRARELESLGVLAGGVAHDFNNILAGILGHVELSLDHVNPDSPPAGYLEEVREATRRAAELCQEMLAFAGKATYRVEALDLDQIAREMAGALGEIGGEDDGIGFELELHGELPLVEADGDRLRHVLRNLVTNAREAVEDGPGRITISTRIQECGREDIRAMVGADEASPGTFVVLGVADDGAGMDEKSIERAFDPFFSTRFIGRGLGLPAVLGIARSHGGGVTIESEPGTGTTVRVFLPVRLTECMDATEK